MSDRCLRCGEYSPARTLECRPLGSSFAYPAHDWAHQYLTVDLGVDDDPEVIRAKLRHEIVNAALELLDRQELPVGRLLDAARAYREACRRAVAEL